MSDFRAATDVMAFNNEYVFSYGSVLLCLDETADWRVFIVVSSPPRWPKTLRMPMVPSEIIRKAVSRKEINETTDECKAKKACTTVC
jgi:hypothetical protein